VKMIVVKEGKKDEDSRKKQPCKETFKVFQQLVFSHYSGFFLLNKTTFIPELSIITININYFPFISENQFITC